MGSPAWRTTFGLITWSVFFMELSFPWACLIPGCRRIGMPSTQGKVYITCRTRHVASLSLSETKSPYDYRHAQHFTTNGPRPDARHHAPAPPSRARARCPYSLYSLLHHLYPPLPPSSTGPKRTLALGQYVPDPQIPTVGPNGEMDGRVRPDVHPLDGPYEARVDCRQRDDRQRAVG